MNFLYNTAGKLLMSLSAASNSLVVGIMLFALLVRIVLLPIYNRYYKSIKLTEILQPRIDELNKKYAKNNDTRSQKVTELLAKSGYSLFGLFAIPLLHIPFCIGMIGAVLNPQLHIPGYKTLALSIPFIGELSDSLFNSLKLGGFNTGAFLLAAAAVAATYFHDTYIRKHTLIERETVDYCILAVIGIACIVLPVAFSLYWIIVMFANAANLLYVVKFTKVNSNETVKMIQERTEKKAAKSAKKSEKNSEKNN